MRASQQLRMPLEVSGVLFEAVRGWVSHQALRKEREQYQLLHKQDRAPCKRILSSSHGLPCSHALERLEGTGQRLLLEHFHPHWYLKRDVTQPRPILEPKRLSDRLDGRYTQSKTSTTREPSGFEMIEPSKRAPKTCSKCHITGHIMTSKNCPLRFQDILEQEQGDRQPGLLLASATRTTSWTSRREGGVEEPNQDSIPREPAGLTNPPLGTEPGTTGGPSVIQGRPSSPPARPGKATAPVRDVPAETTSV